MKRILLCIVFVLFLQIPAQATDIIREESDILGIDDLKDHAPSDVELDIDESTSLDDGLKGILGRIKDEAQGIFTASLSCVGVIIAVAVLGAIVRSIQGNTPNNAPRYVDAVSAIAISAAAAGNINTFMGMAERAIESIADFTTVLFPTLAATVAASGSPAGAVVRHSASVFFSSTLISAINSVLVPLLYTYIAAATANAAIENTSIGKICAFLEWFISGTLKVLLTAFLAYISISGFVASTGDVAGVKAISAVGSAVPVIGGILSGATDAVLSGAKVLKNSVGIFGLISVISICLTPTLILAINYFTFKGAGALLSPVCDAKSSELVGKIGTAFGMMLAITASCALLIFIAIISCMFAVGIA